MHSIPCLLILAGAVIVYQDNFINVQRAIDVVGKACFYPVLTILYSILQAKP